MLHSSTGLSILLVVVLVSRAAAQCAGNPAHVSNGAWSCAGTPVDGTCTATCKSGYTSAPAPTSVCQANGTWTSPTTVCHKVCTTVPDQSLLPNGTWPDSCVNTRVTQRCVGTCTPGTYGSPSIMCISTGYDPSTITGRCSSGAVCSGRPPATITSGSFPTSCSDTPTGQVCYGVCNNGYTAVEPPTTACLANTSSPTGGSWATTSQGLCARVCPGLPPANLLSNGVWPASCNTATLIGAKCQASCSVSGSASILCGTNGWEVSSFTGSCAAAQVCPGVPPNTLVNGRLPTSCSNAAIGSVCTGQCNTGYGSPIPPTVACVSNASSPTGAFWSSTMNGNCNKVCPGLPPAELLPNGVWPSSCNWTTPIGASCQAACDGIGSASIRCGNSGWENSTLTGSCAPSGSVCAGVPPNTLVNGRFPSTCANGRPGDVCTGQCNTGYGSPTPPTVTCVTNSSSSTGASWNSTMNGNCDKVCPGLPPADILPHGQWPVSCNWTTRAGGKCQASCDNGGSATILCGGSGWELTSFTGSCAAPVPVCPGVPPNTLANGAFPQNCSNSPIGSVCSARCNTGYGSPIPPTVACVANSSSPTRAFWSSTMNGNCNKVCPGLPPADVLNNGQWPTSCNWTVPIGGKCDANCSGFGSASISCGNSGWEVSSFSDACAAPGPVCLGNPPVVPVNGRFPTSCANARPGDVCTGQCNTGFGSLTPPTLACVDNSSSPTGASWSSTVNGQCNRVCTGSPPTDLLSPGATWSANCTNNSTFVGETCSVVCPVNGAATITCGSSGWIRASYIGRCSLNPVCYGLPPVALNGQWPASCQQADANSTCTVQCNPSYQAIDPPVSVCVGNGSTAAWSTPIPQQCERGTSLVKRAFMVDATNNQVHICNEVNGTFSSCVANTGAVGSASAQPLERPMGIAISGRRVWISEDRTPSRVRVCNWYGRQLTSCTTSTLDSGFETLRGAGQVVVDVSRSLAFVAIPGSGCISACRNIDTMDDCECSGFPKSVGDSLRGLALGYNSLWAASHVFGTVSRCSLTSFGYDNDTCVATRITNGAASASPYGVYLDTANNQMFVGDTPDGRVWRCAVSGGVSSAVATGISSCQPFSGDGTFGGSVNHQPATAGMELSGGRLFVPLGTGRSVSVCQNPATLSGCRTVFWGATGSASTVNIVIST